MEPVKKFKAGALELAVWKNTSSEGREFFTVSMDRNYKDGDEFKKTNSLRENDLPKARTLLQKAYEFIIMKEE